MSVQDGGDRATLRSVLRERASYEERLSYHIGIAVEIRNIGFSGVA
jgi:hypothetical protein